MLKNEQEVTASINELYAIAEKAKDRPGVVMLQWFVTEQMEEVERVLAEIGAQHIPQILVYNKLDLLEPSQRPRELQDWLPYFLAIASSSFSALSFSVCALRSDTSASSACRVRK